MRALAMLAAAAALLLSAPALAAQDQCSTRASVLARLAAQYGEAPVALGVTGGGKLLELLTTADGATWTIIVTLPGGETCLVAAGEGWRTIAPADPQA